MDLTVEEEWADELVASNRVHDDVDMFLRREMARNDDGGHWAQEMRLEDAYHDREREQLVNEYTRDFEG